RAERPLVGGYFLEDRALAPAVSQDVDEVEDHCHEREPRERVDLAPRGMRLLHVVDLQVLEPLRRRRAEPLELQLQELALEAIARPLVVRGLLPQLGVLLP